MGKSEFTITSDNIKLVQKATEQQILKALEECGMTAERYAKENLTDNGSVNTGNLRNSMTYQTKKREVLIGSAVEYAPYVELGTGIYAESGGGRWKYRSHILVYYHPYLLMVSYHAFRGQH